MRLQEKKALTEMLAQAAASRERRESRPKEKEVTTRTQAYAEARRDRAASLPVYPPPAGASPRAAMRAPRNADVIADELDEAASWREGAMKMLLQEAADALRGEEPLDALPLPTLPTLNGLAAALETLPGRVEPNRAAATRAVRAAVECLRGATGGAIKGRPEEAAARAALESVAAALAAANSAGRAAQAAQADDGDAPFHLAILDAVTAYAALAAGQAAHRAAAAVRAVCEGRAPIHAANHLRRAAAAQEAGDDAIAAASANAPPASAK